MQIIHFTLAATDPLNSLGSSSGYFLPLVTPVFALDNGQSAAEMDGAKPALWKDYETLYHDFVGCIAGVEPAKLTHSVCEQLDQRRVRDALKQAVHLNVATRQAKILRRARDQNRS